MIDLGRNEHGIELRELSERIHSCRADELDYYRSILDLSRAQRAAIVEGDTDALARATEEKTRLMSVIDAIGLKIASLMDETACIAGARSHACVHRDHVATTAATSAVPAAGCGLNARIVGVMAGILEAECANQELLEQAISGVSEELKQIDAGGKAVRAYWGRGGQPTSTTGAIDDNA